MKKVKYRLHKFAALIMIISLFSSLNSFSFEESSKILNYNVDPELQVYGPTIDLSSILNISTYYFELLSNELGVYETSIERWMYSEDYFGDPEAISEIECWMLLENYFGDK